MKKIGIVVFAATVLIGGVAGTIFSFGKISTGITKINLGSSVNGSGMVITQKREVRNFTSVEVGGVFIVEVAAQKEFGIEIDADDNLLEHIETSVENGVLSIRTKTRVRSSGPIKVRVSAPSIKSVDASGASKVSVNDLDNDAFEGTTSGASKLELSGSVSELTLEASGASKIDGGRIDAARANVTANGASKIRVNVSGELRSRASGASRIQYSGEPSIIETSGASSIQKN